MNKPSFIIPSASFGYKAKSIGNKSLIKVNNGETLLEFQLSTIEKVFPKTEVIIVGGYQIYNIQKILKRKKFDLDVSIIENKKHNNTNVAYTISLGLKLVKNDYSVIIYNDLIYDYRILQSFKNKNNLMICYNSIQTDFENVGVILNKDKIKNLNFTSNYKWSQILGINKKTSEKFIDIAEKQKSAFYFCHEILNILLNQDININYKLVPRYKVTDIDTPKEIKWIQENYEIFDYKT